MPSTLLLMSSFLAPSSTRPTSRIRTIRPSGVVLTMTFRTALVSTRRPSVLRVTWVCWPATVGDWPIWPAATWRFCSRKARHHVAGRHVADRQLVGIEPDPHAVVALAEHPHVADARQPRQLGLELDQCVVGEVELVEPAVG